MSSSSNSSIQISGSFLMNTRKFPLKEADQQQELNKAWIDIARAVNERTLGIFSTVASLTGNQWYSLETNASIQNQSVTRNTFRQVFSVSDSNLTQAHNISSIGAFVAIYGVAFDGTRYYPLPYVDTASVSNQISIWVTSTNLILTKGGGAPAINSGSIILEWLP